MRRLKVADSDHLRAMIVTLIVAFTQSRTLPLSAIFVGDGLAYVVFRFARLPSSRSRSILVAALALTFVPKSMEP